MKFTLSLVCIVFFLNTGCLKSNVYFRNYEPVHDNQISDETYHTRFSYFGFGYWPDNRTVNASKLCPKGKEVSRILTETGFVDGLLSVITLNIYSPRSMYVACANENKQSESRGS